jgi:hypothetical protein
VRRKDQVTGDVPAFVVHNVDRAGHALHALFYADAVLLVRPIVEPRSRGMRGAVVARQRDRAAGRGVRPGQPRRPERLGRAALVASGRVVETFPRAELAGVRLRRSLFGYWTLRLALADGRSVKLGRGAAGSEPYRVVAPLLRAWQA